MKRITGSFLCIDINESGHAKKLVIVNNKGRLYLLNEIFLFFFFFLFFFCALHDGIENTCESPD